MSVTEIERLKGAVGPVDRSCMVVERTYEGFEREGKWKGGENRIELEDVLQYC